MSSALMKIWHGDYNRGDVAIQPCATCSDMCGTESYLHCDCHPNLQFCVYNDECINKYHSNTLPTEELILLYIIYLCAKRLIDIEIEFHHSGIWSGEPTVVLAT